MKDILDVGYTSSDREKMIQVDDLTMEFRVKDLTQQRISLRTRYKTALDNVSFTVNKGDTYGITGETGSGKSTLAKIILGVYKPTSGSISLLGDKIKFSNRKHIRNLRENIGIVFQDPVGSLNPRLTVYDIIKEGLINARDINKNEYDSRISSISKLVGLRESRMELYPRDISGGEKQRVSIARVLVAPKKILILDEPTSSLDVSIQAQILNLLKDIKEELDLTYIFITHDINVMKYMSNKLGIFYYGKLVEKGSTKDLVENPRHPYTQRLILNSTRTNDGERNDIVSEEGPSYEGCIFRNSCSSSTEKCLEAPPAVDKESHHGVSCWLFE